MDITVAYFHSLLRPEVVKQDFEQIRSAGASSLLYTIHEQEEQRSPRDFERGLRLAQDAGLKIDLGLGRFGNMFAGPALVPSWYTFRHLQSRVMDQHGRYHEISCFNHQSFRSWLFREIERYLVVYPINGILIDEPGGLDVTCYCPACRALCPDVTDLSRFRRRSMIAFLRELCAYVKQVDPHVKMTIVLHPQDISLVEDLASIEALDVLGGHLFWNILQEPVARVEQWGREIVEALRHTGKRSQLWLQNFNLDARSEAEMETAFTHILNLEPDELGCYYFWRNNDNPTRVWETSRRLLRRVPRRQMRWRTYAPTPQPLHPAVTLPSRPGTNLSEKAGAPTATVAATETISAVEEVLKELARTDKPVAEASAATNETVAIEPGHKDKISSVEPSSIEEAANNNQGQEEREQE